MSVRSSQVAKDITELITNGGLRSPESLMAGVNSQIAVLFAELVDEIILLRKDIEEMDKSLKKIERRFDKK